MSQSAASAVVDIWLGHLTGANLTSMPDLGDTDSPGRVRVTTRRILSRLLAEGRDTRGVTTFGTCRSSMPDDRQLVASNQAEAKVKAREAAKVS